MLTNKKIDSAISSFSISYMNNVKWKRLLHFLVSHIENDELFILGKPVWSDTERRISYRLDQITNTGIIDPGLFGNDQEEYRQIEYLKISKQQTNKKALIELKEWCCVQNIECNETENYLVVSGYA